MPELSDQWLLRKFCAGEREAFDALFRRYAPRVHATGYRLTNQWEDAEDVLQEVFLRLARHAGEIRSGAALSTWLYRTAVNCAADRLRRRRAAVSLDEEPAAASRIIAMESLRRQAECAWGGERERMLRRLEALIPRLPERQAAVFVLRYYQGLSHAAIGEIVGCGAAASRGSLSLACRSMREWVAGEEAEAGETNGSAAGGRDQ